MDDLATGDTGDGTAPLVDIGGHEYQPDCGSVTNYCTTSPNSVGPGALITYLGSPSVSAADLQLQAIGCPPNQFGIFYYGSNEISPPFGEGVRCVGAGTTGIYRSSPFLTDPFGFATMAIDFPSPPAGGGPGQLIGGSIWKFQFWYRDPSGGPAGYNLSDGLSIVFCP